MSITALVSFLPASAEVGDPSATRTVYITVGVLIVLGLALAALAVWLVRRTRPEPQLLAPLEEMETRAWRKQDPAGQRRALDASRPVGARPVRREAAEPAVDAEFAAARPVVSFDDLADGELRDGPLVNPSMDPAADEVSDSTDGERRLDDSAVDVFEFANADIADTDTADTGAVDVAEGSAEVDSASDIDSTGDLDTPDDVDVLGRLEVVADQGDRDQLDGGSENARPLEAGPAVSGPAEGHEPEAADGSNAAVDGDSGEPDGAIEAEVTIDADVAAQPDANDTAPVATTDAAAGNVTEPVSAGRRLLRRARRT